jgi:hypothetical protein
MVTLLLGQLEVQEMLTVIDVSSQCVVGEEAEALDSLLKAFERTGKTPDVPKSSAQHGDPDYVDDCSVCVPWTNGNRHHARCPRY